MAMTKTTLKNKLTELYEAQTEETVAIDLDSDGNVSGSTTTTTNKVTSDEMEEIFDVIAEAIVTQLADKGIAIGDSTADSLDVG